MHLTLSDKQKEYILHCSHRWNIKSGAVRSGKSFVDMAFVVPQRIREREGYAGLNVILGVSKESIERNVLQPMREIYTGSLVGTINSRNIAHICGEEVYCLGAEKISQVAKIQGSSIKYCYGDEVAKWNKEVFRMLQSRLDKSYSCFDGSCNPEQPTHWLKEFIDSEGIDLYLQTYQIFDNPYLPKEYLENLCKEYEGTIYYDRYILGQWKRAEGSIYRKFADDPERFIQPVDKTQLDRIEIGVDFGGNKSGHSFVASGKAGNKVHALMSRRYMNADYPGGIDGNKLADIFLQFVNEVRIKYGLADRVYWDNAETVLGQSITNAMRREFPSVLVLPAKKERIKDRITYTVQLMGAGLFALTGDCTTLSKALQDAVWNDKTAEEERLDDGTTDIDTLDAFEYTIERDMHGKVQIKAFKL